MPPVRILEEESNTELPSRLFTKLFTVPSLHRKLDQDDYNSLLYNMFAPQLANGPIAQQIENGMNYTMFTGQYRMTAGVKELLSQIRSSGRHENAA